MSLKRNHIIIAAALLVLIGGLVWFGLGKKPVPVQFGCVKETQEIEAVDTRFMAGVLEEGKTYEALMGFYECNPPQAGDVVLYRFSTIADPVIKVVRGVEGDKFELVADKDKGNWNLKINGDLIMSGDQPYFFGSRAKPTLSLYEKDRNNVLGRDEVILLSNVPPGKDDSGMFGLAGRKDLIAKIKLP